MADDGEEFKMIVSRLVSEMPTVPLDLVKRASKTPCQECGRLVWVVDAHLVEGFWKFCEKCSKLVIQMSIEHKKEIQFAKHPAHNQVH